eukprot:scaffold523_cov446-Prasinococcus_capsulatus_cf.AAC.18
MCVPRASVQRPPSCSQNSPPRTREIPRRPRSCCSPPRASMASACPRTPSSVASRRARRCSPRARRTVRARVGASLLAAARQPSRAVRLRPAGSWAGKAALTKLAEQFPKEESTQVRLRIDDPW